MNAEPRVSALAGGAGTTHVIALGTVSRGDEFADGGNVADKVRQEVHGTQSLSRSDPARSENDISVEL
ncbi:hypothetical protein BFN67_04310 [Pseudaminobacter manganicus]|uniref:Uncharacterized protein n=1 Tax=Manganibacter manganicus TaxID=1873176 RepID=A0A1V8RNU3_9HYPH|nr:hypothetical protein BFN67_04310 [Pseudaminobacter manganicus]